jgi:hypothetical protein
MKRMFLAGALSVMAVALLRPSFLGMEFTIALGALVAGGLAAVALLLFLRDRDSLAPAENAAISALGIALLVALPFVAGDFLYAAGQSPWRAGALALLVFVYATARLTATGSGGAAVLTDLALAIFGAAVALLTLVALFGPPDIVTGGAWLLVIFALVLVILIVQALRERDAASGRQAIVASLAAAPAAPFDAFIDGALAAPALSRATVLEGDAFADYDAARLRSAFDDGPVTSAAEARAMGVAGEALSALMETHEATHAVLVGDKPLRILAVNAPGLAAGPHFTTQLTLLHKLAMASHGEPR